MSISLDERGSESETPSGVRVAVDTEILGLQAAVDRHLSGAVHHRDQLTDRVATSYGAALWSM